jgi:NAD(P)H-dependent FMN reductase
MAGNPPDGASVLVILGSTRAGRRCPMIAAWVLGIARSSTNLSYEVADLLDWHLPADDEPCIPCWHPGSRRLRARTYARLEP